MVALMFGSASQNIDLVLNADVSVMMFCHDCKETGTEKTV